jgi:hypothetical protein
VAELTETQLILVVVGVVVLAVLAIFVTIQVGRGRRRRLELRERFGSEYGRTIEQAKSRRAGEEELLERQDRHRHVRLHPVSEARVADFRERLEQLQSSFVTAPVSAVRNVDGLLTEVAVARGYPDGAPDRILSDVSVDHPEEVAAHRRGQALLTRADATHAPDTERLRRAFVASRQLFDVLVAEAVPAAETTAPGASSNGSGRWSAGDRGSDPAGQAGAAEAKVHERTRREPEPLVPPPASGDASPDTPSSSPRG